MSASTASGPILIATSISTVERGSPKSELANILRGPNRCRARRALRPPVAPVRSDPSPSGLCGVGVRGSHEPLAVSPARQLTDDGAVVVVGMRGPDPGDGDVLYVATELVGLLHPLNRGHRPPALDE